jgi:hypothetical protein
LAAGGVALGKGAQALRGKKAVQRADGRVEVVENAALTETAEQRLARLLRSSDPAQQNMRTTLPGEGPPPPRDITPAPKPAEPAPGESAPSAAAPKPARGKLSGSLDGLTPAERAAVEALLAEGRNVEVVPRTDKRTPDFKIDGIATELKTISGVAKQTPEGLSAAIASRIMDGRGQANHILVSVLDQAGMTLEIATRGIRRAYGADNKSGGKIQSIRIIGQGFDVTVPRMP